MFHSTRAAIIIATAVLVSACGGSTQPADPLWITEEAGHTLTLGVLDDGTQLAIENSLPQLRSTDGVLLGSPTLPWGNPQHIVAQGDQFLLFGVTDADDVWRVSLDGEGNELSSQILYDGAALSGLIRLVQRGSATLLYWQDSDVYHWYDERSGTTGALPSNIDVPFTFTAQGSLFYVDSTSSELIEIDLTSQDELARESLPSAFNDATNLYVNSGFVVGSIPTELHDGVDLIVQHRDTGAQQWVRSLGGYGTFILRTLGQDQAGNIYYYYYAGLAHAGFNTGIRVRMISDTTVDAWDFRLAGGQPLNYRVTPRLLEEGIQVMHVDQTRPLNEHLYEQRNTTYYAHLNSAGQAVHQFYIQPYRVALPFGNISYPQVIDGGYLGRAFGVDADGFVYLYGEARRSPYRADHFAAKY